MLAVPYLITRTAPRRSRRVDGPDAGTLRTVDDLTTIESIAVLGHRADEDERIQLRLGQGACVIAGSRASSSRRSSRRTRRSRPPISFSKSRWTMST